MCYNVLVYGAFEVRKCIIYGVMYCIFLSDGKLFLHKNKIFTK